MNKRMLSLTALLLACLMLITACGKKPNAGTDDPDQQQGSSGGNTGNQGGSGSGNTGNTGNTNAGNNTGGSQTDDPKAQKLGTVDGTEYWLIDYRREPSANDATAFQLYATAGGTTTVLYATEGVLEYAQESLEQSGNTALYFTASSAQGGNATLYCYDLYNKTVQQILAAPCSNMAVFSGSGKWDGYGWILQEDYVMAIDLQRQTADMTMAASLAELSGFSDVGSSFFGDQKSASIKENEYGVLEITLKQGSTLTGYLYTCDTFTAVKLK